MTDAVEQWVVLSLKKMCQIQSHLEAYGIKKAQLVPYAPSVWNSKQHECFYFDSNVYLDVMEF